MSEQKSKQTPPTGKAGSDIPPHPSELKNPADALKSKPDRKRYTESEKDFVRKNAGILHAREIADKLGRTSNSIRIWASSNGVSLRAKNSRLDSWKQEETEFLKANAKKMSVHDIAQKLGRSVSAVTDRASVEGISLRQKNRLWTDKELEFLLENAGKLRVQSIAKKLGRSYGSVVAKARDLDVSVAVNGSSSSSYKNPVRKGFGKTPMKFTMARKSLPQSDQN